MNEEVVKDYGKITIPTKWEEVSLKQFEDIMRITGGETKNVDIVSILTIMTGMDRDYINSLPADFVDKLMAHLIFLNDTPKQINESQSQIKIKGDFYQINFMEKLTFGEYVFANELIKNDPFDYAGVLAILCRKQGEKFNSEFENENFQKRKEMYEGIPITDALPLVGFFLRLYLISKKHSPESLTEAKSQISQLVQSIETSLKGGDGKKRSLIWRITTGRKLKKLKKQLSQI